MKKAFWFLTGFMLVFAMGLGLCHADNLQWDYPSDWDIITGYLVYFNETGETDNPHIKNVAKADLTQDGVSVTYPDIVPKLNLQIGQTYDCYITAWNEAGESGPSETVAMSGPDVYVPPGDSLPSGTIIEIPNAAITIRVQ